MLTDTITKIGKQIADLIPDSARETRQEIEKNIRCALQSAVSRMDLVSREEFDVQAAVLKRTREKLDQMEKQVEALEKASQPKPRATRTRKTATATQKPGVSKKD